MEQSDLLREQLVKLLGWQDAHLNEHANDQVMKDLAAAIESAIPTRE